MPKPCSTFTSREFNRDTARAKKAAQSGPVFITDRGKPAHVLLSIAEYEKLAGTPRSLYDAVVPAEAAAHADVGFEPPPLGPGVFRLADLD